MTTIKEIADMIDPREAQLAIATAMAAMGATEDIDNLRDACEKMQMRHDEFEQRHKS